MVNNLRGRNYYFLENEVSYSGFLINFEKFHFLLKIGGFILFIETG